LLTQQQKDRDELEEVLSRAMNGIDNWLLVKEKIMYNVVEDCYNSFPLQC
jgi:hypothetical protein